MIDIVFDDDGRLVPLVVDATVEELHVAGAIVTETEVELGANRNDHIRPTGRTFVVKLVVSPTPLATAVSETAEIKIPPGPVQTTPARWDGSRWTPARDEMRAGKPIVATVLRDPNAAERVPDAIAILDDAVERGLLALVTTPRRVYRDAAIVAMTEPRTVEDWLQTELTFKELRFQATELVDDPLPSRPRDRRQVDRGSQEPQQPPPRLESGLDQIFDFFRGS